MNIGLFFGSFNPVHNGHLIIANYFINETMLDQVWLVVSPQNPLKKQSSLLNEYHRLALVATAIEGEPKLKASNVEFQLPRPSYTIDTLTYLKERHPSHQFSIIMGSDSIQNIHNWKNHELLLRNHRIYVYNRPGNIYSGKEQSENIQVVSAPLLEISSTYIRSLIVQKKSIRYLVPDTVREEIENNLFYSNHPKTGINNK